MDNNEQGQASIRVSKFNNSKISTKKVILMLIALVLIAGIGFAGKYYYSKLFVKTQNDIGNLQVENYWRKDEIIDLVNYRAHVNDQINYLLSQQNSANTANNTPVYVRYYVDIDIEKFTTYTPEFLKSTGYKLLLLDYKAKNNNAQDAYFGVYELKLKDANNYEYQPYSSYNYGSGDSILVLPEGRTQQDYLNLKPGEETRGTLVFVLTRDIETASLFEVESGREMVTMNL